MIKLNHILPYSSLGLGILGVVLMVLPLTDPLIVQHQGTQHLMILGGGCSLLGVVAGIILRIRHTSPKWASTAGLAVSLIPLVLFLILLLALMGMAHDS